MIRATLVMLGMMTVFTGLVYPLATTVAARALFPRQAGGSLITDGGRVVGSTLIGQQFDEPRYFWGRLSATGPFPYNAASSSGSNYGPHHPELAKAMAARRETLLAADPGNTAPIPMDLLTSSASGLDPDISPEAAEYQAGRVAQARGLDESRLRKLIARYTSARQFSVLGEPRVNVAALNRALDHEPQGDGK